MSNKWLRFLYILILLIAAQECFCQAGEGNAEERLLTMDFNEAEISDVLRILSEEYGLNIIAGGDVSGRITVSFSEVELDDALISILRTNGYDYVREGNIIRVIKLGEPGVETVTRIIVLKHVDAEDIKNSLSGIITRYGKIEIMRRTKGVGSEKTQDRSSVLVITDIPSNVKKIEDIVSRLDVPSPQIMIQAKIMEVSLDRNADIGIDWNLQASATGAGRSTTFPFNKKYTGRDSKYFPRTDPADTDFPARGGFPYVPYGGSDAADFRFGTLSFADFKAVVKLIESTTDTNILSSPQITTLDNQEASIHVGKKIPVPTYSYNDDRGTWEITGYEDEDVGITLKVTPHVSEGNIIMAVAPEISEIIGWVVGPSGNEEKPQLSARSANTQVRVKDGETIVIGGLIKDKKGKMVSKVPFLGDIPIIGLFFRRNRPTKEKIDLLIFLTPHILTDEIEQKDTGRMTKGNDT
jgi:type IV pilus assembly protein PilQ